MKKNHSEQKNLFCNLVKKIIKFILKIIPRSILIRASYLARPLLTFWYKGTTFTDPIDGKSFKKFLPYGYNKIRINALSPSTLSLERHRLLWLYLKNKTQFFTKQAKVLHVAPEQAFYQRFKNLKHLDYLTTDLYSPLADVKADICDLPFESNSFDWVFCNHVLEHILDDTKAMQEIFRVLKPKGIAILQVPQDLSRKHTFEDHTITDKKQRTEIFGQYDHVRIYGYDYFNKLRSVGFVVDEVLFSDSFSDEDKIKFSLPTHEIIPVCYK